MPDEDLHLDPGEAHACAIIIVKPFRVESVLRALSPFRIASLTLSQVRGYGRQKGHLELYRGREYAISFIPKVKLEVVAPRQQLPDLIRAVETAARTGRIGDGKIFIFDLEVIEIW